MTYEDRFRALMEAQREHDPRPWETPLVNTRGIDARAILREAVFLSGACMFFGLAIIGAAIIAGA